MKRLRWMVLLSFILLLLPLFGTYYFNGCLRFAGLDQHVQLPDESAFDFTTNMTVEAWIQVEMWTEDYQAIVTKGDNTWRLHRNYATNDIRFTAGGVSVTASGYDFTDDWYHIAATKQGGTLAIYVNGVLCATTTGASNISTDNSPVWIGGNSQQSGRSFYGKMDEVRIWNYARNNLQIKANRFNHISPSSSGLIAYYKLDSTSGNTAYDATGNHNGTLQNYTVNSWYTNSISYQNFLGDSAYEFAGDNDDLSFAPLWSSAPSQLTAEVWFNPSELPSGEHTVLYHGDNGEFEISVVDDSIVGKAKLASGYWLTYTYPGILPNQWYHAALVVNVTGFCGLYINGSLVGSDNLMSEISLYDPGITCSASIGSRYGTTQRFRGLVDEVRIWNYPRTATQIMENRHSTVSNSESGLIAYYQFNEGGISEGELVVFNMVNTNAIGTAQCAIAGNAAPARIASTWPVGENYYGGIISANTTWPTDNLKIWGNITINSGVKLTLNPGTTLSFLNHYGILANGSLQAVGTPADSITITVCDTTGFYQAIGDELTIAGSWNGIVIKTTSASDSTLIDYCRLKYAKADDRYIANAEEQWQGGAVFVNGTDRYRISNSRISNNIAANQGAGIALYNAPGGIIKDCDISYNHLSNSSTVGEISSGGGIYIYQSDATIQHCNIRHNEVANCGAGIMVAGGDAYHANLLLNTITDNVAGTKGGGICLTTYLNSTNIMRNFIDNNTAVSGGGIATTGASTTLSPSVISNVISNNHADYGGGMLVGSTHYGTYKNNTITGNEAEIAGGGLSFPYSSTITMFNTIIWGNTSASGSQINLDGTSYNPYFRSCDIEGGIAEFSGAGATVYPSERYISCIDADPEFETSPELPYKLFKASPCINRGEPGSETGELDFAGNPRVYQTGLHTSAWVGSLQFDTVMNSVDIGAYEDQSDTGVMPYDYTMSYVSFNHNLTIPHGITLTLSNAHAGFAAEKGIDIYGSMISGETDPEPYGMHELVAQNPTLGWAGLSFLGTPGLADSSYVYHVRIAECNVSGSDYPVGGAIYINTYNKLVISNCEITDNTAVKGGAIAVVDASPRIYNNVIHDCSASEGGGAIYCENAAPYLVHNTIINNNAPLSGAILGDNSANTRITGCLIWNNGSTPVSAGLNTTYSDIEGGYAGNTNFNTDPLLLIHSSFKAELPSNSPCMNKGILDTSNYPNFPIYDIVGNPRVWEHEISTFNRLDVGACEYQGYMEVSDFQASDGDNAYPGYVYLTWNFDASYQPFAGFRIYRDNVLLSTLYSRVYNYSDHTAIPGTRHVYSIQAYSGNEHSVDATDIGYIKPNGIITGTITTPNNNPVSGVAVSLSPSLGYCLGFDEASFFGVEIPSISFSTSFTLETWIKTLANDFCVLRKVDYDFIYDMQLKVDSDGLLLFTDGVNTLSQEVDSLAVNDNAWHHIAVSYDASIGTGYIYLDDVCVADSLISFNDTIAEQTALLTDIEGRFTGYMDDIRLWNVTRTDEQIISSANVIIPFDSPGLLGYWPMNEGTGNEAFDATDYGNHAELMNNMWSANEPGIALGGVSNDWGEYVISQIPYGHYTTFTVTPHKDGHFFQPQQRLITLSETSISANNVDFTDNSLVSISGRIMYVNTIVPVRNAYVMLNGHNTVPPTLSNEDGYYVMDVEHGTNCTISASFNNQSFNRIWELGAVTFPQANKHFYDVSKVNFQLEVLGGEDRYTIGAFDVTLRSVDDLYELPIYADSLMWELGIVSINNIPPLNYNVSVTPNAGFAPGDPFGLGNNLQFLNNNTKNLNLLNPVNFSDSPITVADTLTFIWKNPMVIEVAWPMDYELKYLSGDEDEEFGFYVVEQNEWITVTIRAFEDYSFGDYLNRRTYVRNCDILINDEVGPAGISETNFNGSSWVNYSFAPYLPNLGAGGDRSYQNMLEITVYDPIYNRYATQTDWALIHGARPTESTFSTVSPEIPFLILHDPPGDQSYSSFRQSSSHSTTLEVSVQKTENNNRFTHVHLGPDIIFEVGFMFSSQTEIDVTIDMDYGLSCDKTQTRDTLQVYTFTTTEEYKTSDQNALIGRESDLYIGGALNMLWGVTRVLNYHEDDRTVEITNDIMVTPDGFATTYIYTESQILLTVIPNALAIGDTTSANMWQSFVDMNSQNIATAVENENHPANISFNAGAGYLYEETTVTDSTYTYTTETVTSEEFGSEFGNTVNGVGGEFGFGFATQYTWGNVNSEQSTTETTISYELADDDETSNLNYQSDYFTVDIKKDPVYGTPVFNTLGGASSNRWEPNTQPRDGVDLTANTYTASGLLEGEQAVFQLNLQNTSQTNEDRRYYLTMHHETNPDGALILINGLPLVERMPFDILAGQTVQAIMTVIKGPIEWDYEGITLEMYCEGDRGNEGPEGHKFYDYKSFNIHWETPYSKVAIAYPHDGWIMNKADNDTLRIRLNGYDTSKPGFESILLQYKRPYNPDWIPILTIPLEDLEGTTYTIVPWDASDLEDGPFEIRAGTKNGPHDDYYCDPILGYVDRSAPELLNLPQPSDGILSYGEAISVSFTEFINPDNILAPDDITLEIVRTATEVDIEITRFENTVYIQPNIANYWMENEVMRAKVSGLSDLHGNPLEDEVIWEFYVNANPVAWVQPKLEVIKPLGQAASVTTYLNNSGGQWSSFEITDLPDWLSVDTGSGTLLPLDSQALVFTVSNQLGYGTFRDTVYADIPALGREPLIFEISVLANPPSWATTQLGNFDYSMTITGQLQIDGEISTDSNDIIGAFVIDTNGEYVCRGYANLQRVPYLADDYQFFLTINSDEEDGEELIFRVWDNSTSKEHIGISEQYVFSSGDIHGTPLNAVTIHVSPELFRSIPCRNGWNWVSVNLENPLGMDVNNLLSSLSPASSDIVKSQTTYDQYVPDIGWVGSMGDIPTTGMVKLKLSNSDQLELTGLLENPVTTPVNYGSGWNWIGYLPHVSISVNQALANITAPVSGYLIKNQTGYSQYIEGYGWYGSMLFMEAGKGYMLHASDSGSFTYPDYIFPRDDIPTLSGANIDKLRELTGWDLNPLDYEYSSNVTSVVQCNNVLLNEENIVLGAFYGSECRGIAVPVKVLDQWVFFLTQYSNVINQQLSYKVYLADNDEVLDAAETLPFVNNQILGNPLNPYTFHIAVESLQIPQNLSLTVEESALTLSWDAVAGAVSYKVFASNTPTGDFTEVTSLGSFIRAAESKTDTFSSSIHSFEKPGTAEERARQSWFCTIPDMQKMFYYITASTDSRRF